MQVAVLTRLQTLVLVCVLLSGCAHYDWTFNKFQDTVDTVRHINGKLEQGSLP